MLRIILFAMLTAALAFAQGPPDARAKQVIDDAIKALGGEKFLNMEDRTETGRAYSFYQDKLSGLAVARIYTRYVTVDPAKSGHDLAVRERQSFGKKEEETAVVFLENEGSNVNWRTAKKLTTDEFERYRESTLRNVLYLFRHRLKEPGMFFESKGSNVVDRLPVEVVDIIDSQNRVTTVYFHQATKLPVKQVYTRMDQKTRERFEEVTRFDRYRESDGIQWPQQITRERDGDKVFQIFSESVRFNQDLTDDLFATTLLPGKVKQ